MAAMLKASRDEMPRLNPTMYKILQDGVVNLRPLRVETFLARNLAEADPRYLVEQGKTMGFAFARVSALLVAYERMEFSFDESCEGGVVASLTIWGLPTV